MNNDTVALAIDRLRFYANDALLTLTQCICKPDASLKINGRSYTIEKLLGEGAAGFVYLVRDQSNDRLYALKKVLVTTGNEGYKEAMREVEAYKRFRHPNIITILDSAVVQDEHGDGRIIYLLLPFYSRGNLQDMITSAATTGHPLTEEQLLKLFHGTCLAVRALHQYHARPISAAIYPPSQEGDALITQPDPVFDGDEELGSAESGELIPYAHRDIKPGNIMIADDGSPILMDFGSTTKARIEIKSRQQALLEQDLASERSTMPYRAPELFDVKTGAVLDEKVDIWSLGCTLFAVAYGHSPFEVDGQSIAMAVGSGRYRHPSGYSDRLVALIDALLVVNPAERPDIQTVIALTERALTKS